MQRRTFLLAGASLPLACALPQQAFAQQLPFEPKATETWRRFETIMRVELVFPSGINRVWLPAPSIDSEWQRTYGNTWSGNATRSQIVHDKKYGAAMLYAEWNESVKDPVIEMTSSFATRDRAIDLSKPGKVEALSPADRAFYTAPTELMPTDGIVRAKAREATRGTKTDMDKARALYDWIVDNTFRDPKTRGCGVGDIKSMLETGNLGGKCADLNALYVGMARAIGLPARDVYGLRVVKSEFGYRSLGAGTDNVTRAQHCRAEVWLSGFGWVPVDPADVRKVVLEEKAAPTTVDDPLVKAVRQKLFGAWEMNWLAYNNAHDITLPGAKGAKIGFLMYPQAETGQGRLDSLDPDNFKYSIRSREITA